MQTLSVKTRLLITFWILSAGILLTGGMGIDALSRTQQNLDSIYHQSMLPTEWITGINSAGEDDLLKLDNAIIAGDTEHVDELQRQFAASQQYSETQWQRYQQSLITEEQKQLAAAFWAARGKFIESRSHILELLNNGQTLVAGSWRNRELQTAFTTQQDLLEQLIALQNASAEQAYQQASSRQLRAKIISLTVIALALSVSIMLGLLVVRSMLRALQGAVATSERIAAGELGYSHSVTGQDEFCRMLNALHQVDKQLCTMVQEVRNRAHEVDQSALMLEQDTDKLSVRTHQQAASLTQVVTNIQHLADTISRNADSANTANQLGMTTRDQANRGDAAVKNAINAMTDIGTASKQIADIVETIDEIAFQTNLLALNAAVEAARAGDQGRGFAIVAAEVQRLAQRSANAAREIKSLITDSSRKVATGTELVSASGQVLVELVSSVKQVTDIVADIAQRGHEQASGITQLSQAAKQIEHSTQENSQVAATTTDTCSMVTQNASSLLDLVQQFKLAQDPPTLTGQAYADPGVTHNNSSLPHRHETTQPWLKVAS